MIKNVFLMIIVSMGANACPDSLKSRLANCMESFGKEKCTHLDEECRTYDAQKCIAHIETAMRLMSKHCTGHIMQKEEDLWALAYQDLPTSPARVRILGEI